MTHNPIKSAYLVMVAPAFNLAGIVGQLVTTNNGRRTMGFGVEIAPITNTLTIWGVGSLALLVAIVILQLWLDTPYERREDLTGRLILPAILAVSLLLQVVLSQPAVWSKVVWRPIRGSIVNTRQYH
jgi:hypothetical protein